MEFGEKLQLLRKQNNMTQEQLADQLFVSRTAISKWESGKGYPNIESLKSISKLLGVSIDSLLSGEELINLAVSENRLNMSKIFGSFYGILDLMATAFIFLPFYGQPEGTYIRAVTLLEYTYTSKLILAVYWTLLLSIIFLGIGQMVFQHLEKERCCSISRKCSFVMVVLAICFFAATRQPYVTTGLFLLFVIKVIMMLKQKQIK